MLVRVVCIRNKFDKVPDKKKQFDFPVTLCPLHEGLDLLRRFRDEVDRQNNGGEGQAVIAMHQVDPNDGYRLEVADEWLSPAESHPDQPATRATVEKKVQDMFNGMLVDGTFEKYIERALNTGALPLGQEGWMDDFHLPKAVLHAIFKELVHQTKPITVEGQAIALDIYRMM